MNNELNKKIIIRHESRKECVYRDTLGLKTAGIGHLLLGEERNLNVGDAVSGAQIDKWFESDYNRSVHIARSLVKNFDQLSDVRQSVIVDMTFNMANKFGDFKKAIAAIEKGDFNKAADEMQDSLWFTQVKKRGIENCFAMRSGKWGFAV